MINLKEDDEGNIDFKNISVIENVVAGQLLAEKISSEEGEVGINIFNQHISANNGKDVTLRAGKGTVLKENGNKLFAETNGQVLKIKRCYLC